MERGGGKNLPPSGRLDQGSRREPAVLLFLQTRQGRGQGPPDAKLVEAVGIAVLEERDEACLFPRKPLREFELYSQVEHPLPAQDHISGDAGLQLLSLQLQFSDRKSSALELAFEPALLEVEIRRREPLHLQLPRGQTLHPDPPLARIAAHLDVSPDLAGHTEPEVL